MRVLHVEPERYDTETRSALSAVGSVDFVECPDQPSLIERLNAGSYDALFTRIGLAVDAAALAAAPKLRFIVTPTTGLDHIDLEGARARGIRVISLRGEHELLATVRSTAEHTWALLLALVRRLPAAHRDVLAGAWRREPFLADELAQKTLGILGLGRLGSMVAGYGLAFGMRVIAHDCEPRRLAGVEQVGLDELLPRSDVLSVHLPLDQSTRGFLGSARIAQLKRGALLINTARGELIDEPALLEALRSRHLAGAALDVLAGDARWTGRIPEGHGLVEYARDHENLVLTPHVGGYGLPSILRTRRFVVDRFVEAVRERTLV